MAKWEHYPDSPFGDVEICSHGCCRPPGCTDKVCIECDYPPDADIRNLVCLVCGEGKRIGTWHLDGKCIRCGTENTEPFL